MGKNEIDVFSHLEIKAFGGAWLGIRGTKRFIIVNKISKKLEMIHGLQEKQANIRRFYTKWIIFLYLYDFQILIKNVLFIQITFNICREDLEIRLLKIIKKRLIRKRKSLII